MSLTSMTGYGHARFESDALQIEVEIRAVNHRFLDLNWKLPAVFSRFEQPLSKIVREQVKRGRIDLAIYRTCQKGSTVSVTLHQDALQTAAQGIRAGLSSVGVTSEEAFGQAIVQLLQRREVLEIVGESENADAEIAVVEQVLRDALIEFNAMRAKEGSALTAVLQGHLATLRGLLDTLEEESKHQALDLTQKLKERVQKLLQDVQLDEGRFAQEIVYLSDRTDITEEIGRMRSHIDQLESCYVKGESGKKVEFLLQELGREVNTSGSKSQRGDVSNVVVAMKVELEKMREQIQNVE